MKVLLGAGEDREEGFVSLDISDKCGADIVADVRDIPWTWATEPLTMIKANNLLEHLTVEERIAVVNEAWDKM